MAIVGKLCFQLLSALLLRKADTEMIVFRRRKEMDLAIYDGIAEKRSAVGVALLLWLFAGDAQAGVIFFHNDAVGFAAAMNTSGNVLIGTEGFEGSTQPPNTVTSIDDPLTQGVSNGPYPSGLTQPITVQSNLSGASAIAPNPRGPGGLAAVSSGALGATSDVVTNNTPTDSLDWIFNPGPQVSGVGLNPITLGAASALEIEIYDLSNALIGSTTISSDAAGTNFLGIQATAGDLIGRINFFATIDSNRNVEGGDNVSLFRAGITQVPEPGSLALITPALAALALSRRRTKRAHAGGSRFCSRSPAISEPT
jgi:hypothetical protein